MSMLNVLGFGKKKCARCDAKAAQASALCPSCGVSMAAPQNDPVLRDNRWVPAPNELAAFFGIGQLKGLFTKTLQVPVGTRAVVIQDGRTTDVPPGDYEVEGFFSRLANLGRDRYAEILITRQAALPVEFDLNGLLCAEFLKLEAKLTLSVAVGDVATFAAQFMTRPGTVDVEQVRELLMPALRQAAAEYTGARSLREMAANVNLRAELEERLLGGGPLKQTLETLGLAVPQVQAASLLHEKLDGNNTKVGELWLEFDRARIENAGQLDRERLVQAHTKQLNALYSDAEWAQIEKERDEAAQRLRRLEQQSAERVDTAKLDVDTRERLQALRDRDLDLYARVANCRTRQQAIDFGAKDAVFALEHDLAAKGLGRGEETADWELVKELARIRRKDDRDQAELKANERRETERQRIGHQLKVQQLRQELEQARLIEDEDVRRAEVQRLEGQREANTQRTQAFANAEAGEQIELVRLRVHGRAAEFERSKMLADAEIRYRADDWKRKSQSDQDRDAQALLDQMQARRERERDAQAQRQADEAAAEQQARRAAEQAERQRQADAQGHALAMKRTAAEAAVAKLQAAKGMEAVQILAVQVDESAHAAQALSSVVPALTAAEMARRSAESGVSVERLMQERDAAAAAARYAAEVESQKAHDREMEKMREGNSLMKHIVDRQSNHGEAWANAQRGATGMGPFVVPPVVTGSGPVHHHYGAASGGMPPRAGSSGGQAPCDYCDQNAPGARFCSHCGLALRG